MRPTKRSVLLGLVAVAIAIAVVVATPHHRDIVPLTWVFCAAGLLFDMTRATRPRDVHVSFTVPTRLYMGAPASAITIALQCQRRTPAQIHAILELDAGWAAVPNISGAANAHYQLPLIPLRRGTHHVVAFHLRWHGPLKLIERRTIVQLDHAIAVLPNTAAVEGFALQLDSDHAFARGLGVENVDSDGSEYHSLQEYQPGMDHRTVDWRATARHRKLLSRKYKAELNHQIVVAIDRGQLMAAPLAGVPRLDHAINSALQLAYLGLRTGDCVGFASFDDSLRQWAAPVAGRATFTQLASLSAAIDYSPRETNYARAMMDIATRLKRRSLLVVFAEFLDTISAELMMEQLIQLRRQHMVIFVTIREAAAQEAFRRAPQSLHDVGCAVVSAQFAEERRRVHEQLRLSGITCVDASPSEVATQLMRHYLEAKRQETF